VSSYSRHSSYSGSTPPSQSTPLRPHTPSQGTDGALQSLCWGCHSFGRVVTAYLSGWLVDKLGTRAVFAITGSFPLVVCVASLFIAEAPSAQSPRAVQGAWPGGGEGGSSGDEAEGELLVRSATPCEWLWVCSVPLVVVAGRSAPTECLEATGEGEFLRRYLHDAVRQSPVCENDKAKRLAT